MKLNAEMLLSLKMAQFIYPNLKDSDFDMITKEWEIFRYRVPSFFNQASVLFTDSSYF